MTPHANRIARLALSTIEGDETITGFAVDVVPFNDERSAPVMVALTLRRRIPHGGERSIRKAWSDAEIAASSTEILVYAIGTILEQLK